MRTIMYLHYLLHSTQLEPHKNLVDQCVKGEGLVQINAQVRTNTQRINIVDVLKPTEDALAEIAEQMRRGAPDAHGDRSGSESPLPDAATVAAAAAIERELAAQTPADDGDDDGHPANRRRAGALHNGGVDEDDDEDYERERRVMRPGVDEDDDDADSVSDAPQPASKPQWIIDTQFKREQNRLKMSDDPKDWTVAQVKHWLQWAVRHFNLVSGSVRKDT